MKLENVSDDVFMKSDAPQLNDLFVVVRENGHQTPYLIFLHDKHVSLINLHSGQSNYFDNTIDELINKYLEENTIETLNPITGYFFTKGYKVKMSIGDTFGYKSV